MWHEARKQEKKIRGLMVDYKRRADRRRDYYEKIVSTNVHVEGFLLELVIIPELMYLVHYLRIELTFNFHLPPFLGAINVHFGLPKYQLYIYIYMASLLNAFRGFMYVSM